MPIAPPNHRRKAQQLVRLLSHRSQVAPLCSWQKSTGAAQETLQGVAGPLLPNLAAHKFHLASVEAVEHPLEAEVLPSEVAVPHSAEVERLSVDPVQLVLLPSQVLAEEELQQQAQVLA